MLSPRRAALCVLACLCAATARAQVPAGDRPGNLSGDEEGFESRPYSIPDKRGARVLYDEARAHAEGGRSAEAITAILRLIEEHSGSLIALPLGDEPAPRSAQTVYVGAAQAARGLLARLTPEGLAAAGERFAAHAGERFARASASFDATELAALARVFPFTQAGARAWAALGDLEAESGSFVAARVAWDRAAASGALSGLSTRREWLVRDTPALGGGARPVALDLAASAEEDPPAEGARPWDATLRVTTEREHPLSWQKRDFANSFPIVADGLVFASDSLTLTAVDALTGRLRWRSEEHPGWARVREDAFTARDDSPVTFQDFFQGVDREGLLIAPAYGSGVVVGALQVPFTANGNTRFQGSITITQVIPDRRLFAFDARTGRPLWNHAPPPLWDCDSGDFTTRMRVAGPPVIVGTRVLAPMWRPQGRIAYHVACFDLRTGAYLWSTQVASGQRPLNMFGRLASEFCAPPLVVVGEKVIALTQLGTLAALDLFSGELLWQTVYDQVALPRADGLQAAPRAMYWRNSPPAVADGVVIATPLDSPDMIGVDLAHGSVLWSLGVASIARPRGQLDRPWYLIGARDDTVYLGGRYIVSRRAAGGLAGDRGPTEELVSDSLFGDGHAEAARLPRAILTARHVLVPLEDRRLALDASNVSLVDPRYTGGFGRRSAGFGNLALGEGTLAALSAQGLAGALDGDAIQARLEAELAAAPDDPLPAARLGDFLRERAAAEFALARHTTALELLARAHRVLAPALGRASPEARRAEFLALWLEARVHKGDARASMSLEPLERALPLAADDDARARVLAEIARLAQGRSRERFESALVELERISGEREFVLEEGETWLGPRAVRRWVLETRISDAALAGDPAREFAALIDLLDRYGDGPLSDAEVPRETPSMRIARRLAAGGRAKAAWPAVEERAARELAAARAAGDPRALERILTVFPHTAAALEARSGRLAAALESRDARTALRLVLADLPARWTPRTSTETEARELWLAARALERAGNPLYSAALLERLAAALPDAPAESGAAPGVTFKALALERAGDGPETGARESTFDAPGTEVFSQDEESVLLGRLDTGGGELFVFAARDRISALTREGKLAWSRPIEGALGATAWITNARLVQGRRAHGGAAAFTGRVVLSWRRGLLALDGATGLDAWTWSVHGSLDALSLSDSGMLVATAMPLGAERVVCGIECGLGLELWRRPVGEDRWPQTVVGSGTVVLLPRPSAARRGEDGADSGALALELATGTEITSLDLGSPASSEDRGAAWIEAGRLVLPRFGRVRAGEDAIAAYDLENGARVWRVPVDDARVLDSIVRVGDETYLVHLVAGPSGEKGGVVELDTRLGATRPVPNVALSAEDLPIGLRSQQVTRLDTPFLFVRSPAPGGRETLIRAIHLPYGPRWSFRLPISPAAPYALSFPLPVVTSRLVVLAYPGEDRANSNRLRPCVALLSIDRESGEKRELRELWDVGAAETVELATLENLLILRGASRITAWTGNAGEERK